MNDALEEGWTAHIDILSIYTIFSYFETTLP